MLQPFHGRIGTAGFESLQAPFPFSDHQRGESVPKDPRPFKVVIQAQRHPDSAGAFRGTVIRVTPVGGQGRPEEYTLAPGATPAEWVGFGESVFVEAQSLGAADALVHGAIFWGCDAPMVPTRRDVANLQRTTALDFATMSADGSNTAPAVTVPMQPDTKMLQVAAGPLTGGGAMVPVSLHVFGREAIPDAAGAQRLVELTQAGGLAVGPAIPGGSAFERIPIVPRQFDATLYMVIGFPAVGGGASSLQVWEELE